MSISAVEGVLNNNDLLELIFYYFEAETVKTALLVSRYVGITIYRRVWKKDKEDKGKEITIMTNKAYMEL